MLYSFGHSNMDMDGWFAITRNLDLVLDIRSHPESSANPQFNMAALQDADGDRYEWWPILGGWTEDTPINLGERHQVLKAGVDLGQYNKGYFPKNHIARKRSGAAGTWTSVGLYDYSWYTSTQHFRSGATALLARDSDDIRIGFFCSEASWWKCHRSLVADYLGFRGFDVIHIPRGHKPGAPYSRHKDYLSARLTRYDDAIIKAWMGDT